MLLPVLICVTGCQTALQKSKRKMFEIYTNDENYITFLGEIIKIENRETYMNLTITSNQIAVDCNEGFQETYNYWVFSKSMIDIKVGDIIKYTTVSIEINNDEWLPIVAIEKNDEILLDYQIGKANLLDWVNQLQMK